jgi:Ca2+-binding EF-hand superfamily protein
MTRQIGTIALALGLACTLTAQERGGRGFPPNLLVTTLDSDHDGPISAVEISNAPAALRALDKNHDGKLTPDETRGPMGFGRGGRGPEGGERREGGGNGEDSVEETVKSLMAFDANGDGKLQKSEVPERMQGIFDRGDADKDGILTADELRTMARAQSQQSAARGRGGEGEREGRGGRGPGGPFIDPVFAALDTNHDNEIDSAEIDRAPTALKALDKNQDGVLSQDEVRPNFPGRGMPGGRR